MPPLLLVAACVVVAVAVLVALQRKQKAKPQAKPQLPHFASSPEPRTEAALWAANYFLPNSYEVTTIGNTGSMVPILQGGETVVLARNYELVKVGDVVGYTTVGGSSPAIGSRIIHRIVGGDAITGWIPQGDTEGMPVEDWNPITRDNYIGTLVAVFKQRL